MRFITYSLALAALLQTSAAFAQSNDGTYQARRVPANQSGNNPNAYSQPGVVQPGTYPPPITSNTNYQAQQESYDARVYVNNAYRQDELKWNIASDPTGTATPNILSELKWTNIGIYQIEGGGQYTRTQGPLRGVHIEGRYAHGWVMSGDNQDSDYILDNRNGEFSRSNNDASEGSTKDYDIALGYAFQFGQSYSQIRSYFTPMIGYSYREQNFRMQDGFQTIPNVAPFYGPIPGLNSRYETEWKTPFIGLTMESLIAKTHRLALRGRYYRGDYNADAQWNLRTDFAQPRSFNHDGDAAGALIGMNYSYLFNRNLEFNLGASYEYLNVEDGIDTVYFSDGTIGRTRLNEVESSSVTLNAGATYRF